MNIAMFTGRVVAEPEMRMTQTGKSVCVIQLAVNRPRVRDGERETDWPTIVCWEKKADFAAKYVTKGRSISVTAQVRTRTYEDDHGKKHKVTEFVVEEIEFIDSKPQGAE